MFMSVCRNPKVAFEIEHATILVAMNLLREIEFDASLVDLHLPDAIELEAFEQIRAMDARIPIVVFIASMTKRWHSGPSRVVLRM